ncbi:MAG: TIGR01777 family oxidoreductase [Salinimicrobium sp.]
MRVLITGATGLIGSKITQLCHEKGIDVSYLTHSKDKLEKKENFKGFYWNPRTGEIDTACLERVGTIINLAGANIFQPWSDKNKKKILNSRIDSLNLLHKTLKENEHEVGQLISASAVGIYPSSTQVMHYEDEQEISDSFLGQVAHQWELAADPFKELDLRVAKVRIGLVLSNEGGALPQMERPVKYNVGAALGKGTQWQSWIHIEDLARLFIFILQNGLQGVYNGVAPNPVTHEDLMEQLARTMGKSLWLPKIPPFLLKTVMGEMSSVVLESQLVSSKKIQEAGFNFHFVNLKTAFDDLWKKKTG